MLRFAPSPIADMHIGDLRVAIINYIVAKQRGDSFIVRIEDTDKERNITGKDTEFMEILEKFALPHDSVSHQSEHLHMHQTLAIRLLEEKKAFVCTCQETTVPYSGHCRDLETLDIKKLKEEKTPFVLRIKRPEQDIITHDLIQGEITATPEDVDDFVILREDSTPSPTFASACDDMISGVTFIIRDEKHLSSTPRQEYIKTLLGFDQQTQYAHLPAILGAEGHIDETITVKWLFEQGFIPDAIVNYLVSLGFDTPTDVFIMPQALEWFDLMKISSSSVKFDIEQLKMLNREHLGMIEDKALSSLFGFADDDIGKLAKLYLDEASTINELALKIRPIFAPKDFDGTLGEQMKQLSDVIFNAPMINDFEDFKAYVIKESGLEEEKLSKPLRHLLTGVEDGPELSDIYPHIKSYILEVAS